MDVSDILAQVNSQTTLSVVVDVICSDSFTSGRLDSLNKVHSKSLCPIAVGETKI